MPRVSQSIPPIRREPTVTVTHKTARQPVDPADQAGTHRDAITHNNPTGHLRATSPQEPATTKHAPAATHTRGNTRADQAPNTLGERRSQSRAGSARSRKKRERRRRPSFALRSKRPRPADRRSQTTPPPTRNHAHQPRDPPAGRTKPTQHTPAATTKTQPQPIRPPGRTPTPEHPTVTPAPKRDHTRKWFVVGVQVVWFVPVGSVVAGCSFWVVHLCGW